MLKTLRNRNFAFVWIAGLVSIFGDYMLFLALPVYIYTITQSTLQTSIMFAAGIIPRLLFGSLAGVFVDRWDRRKIMIVSNIVLRIGLLPLLLVNSAENIWIIYIVQFFESAAGQLLLPAEGALLPMLVPEEDLISANALYGLNNSIARLVGPAAGGLAVGILHLSGIALLDAASFFIAAALLALIQLPVKKIASIMKQSNVAQAVRRVWQEWVDGARLIRRDDRLALLFIIACLPQIGEGVFSTLLAPYVTSVLGGSELEYGYVVSAQAVGGIVGSILLGSLLKKLPLHRVLAVGAFFLGVIDLVIVNYSPFIPGVLPAIILMAIVGVPAIGYSMGLSTLLQLSTTNQYRGRILATFAATSAFLALIGTLLAGSLGETISVPLILNTQGLGEIIVGILGWIYYKRLLIRPSSADILESTNIQEQSATTSS